MTTLILACANCERDYESTREDILKGIKHWRLCPDCRQLGYCPHAEPKGECRHESDRKES